MTRRIIYTALILLLLVIALLVGYTFYSSSINSNTSAAEETQKEQEDEALAQQRAQEEAIENRLRTGDVENGDLKIVFLTFDDGPNDCSNEVLDILKSHDVKATFFTNGRPGYEDVYKRIINEGHVLANHTYSHDYGLYSNTQAFLDDVKRQEDYLRSVTGVEPVKIFRFPGGSNNTNQTNVDALKNMGYTYFDWDASAGDGSSIPLSPQDTYAKIITEVREHPVAIVLCHAENPVKSQTRGALDGVINDLKAEGYTFKTLDPSYNLTKYME